MSRLTPTEFAAYDPKGLADMEGRVAVLVTPEGSMEPAARTANRLTKGALARMIESEAFRKAGTGQVFSLAWPAGMKAEALDVLVMAKKVSVAEARKAGAELAKLAAGKALTVMAGSMNKAADLAMGLGLRGYDFDAHKTPKE